MPLAQMPVYVAIAAAVVGLVLAALCLTLFLAVGPIWLQALMSGVPIRVFDILGMRLRRVNAARVVRALIALKQAGITVSPREMERAYLTGVDLEKVTLAMIKAKKEGMEITFQELVDTAREERPQEKRKR